MKNPPPFEVELLVYQEKDEALVQVKVSDDPGVDCSHAPATIILVIDVSGSMSSRATTYSDMEGGSGLSVLDVVKHAGKTVIQTLSDTDSLGIVSFASNANLVLPVTLMTEDNKSVAIQAIESLYPTDSTNLYDGLVKGLDMVRDEGVVNATIMLLTDGMPNIRPPRGELETLKRYLETNVGLDCRIATFGFGYSLDSMLLHDISVIGKSSYAFIPDSSFVGTIFINAIANILSVACHSPKLQLEKKGDTKLEVSSYHHCVETTWGLSIDLPPLLFGETFSILVKLSGEESDGCVLGATLDLGDTRLEAVPFESKEFLENAKVHDELLVFLYGCLKAKDVMFTSFSSKLDRLKNIVNGLDQQSKMVKALKGDIDGQISEALSREDWYTRWGKHYLLSLSRTHSLHYCLNFKDPGPQFYATQKFENIRDSAEEIFLKLPPPTPSYKASSSLSSMTMYYNSSNPCFASGRVAMSCGLYKDVSLVRPGDYVSTSDGDKRVLCVVETKVSRGFEGLVEIDEGIFVTPWHPVRALGEDRWSFPADLKHPSFQRCFRLFSFVIEGGSHLRLGGVYEAVTLGHGRKGDPCIEHEYLGTEAVIEDLKKMKGWQKGHIVLTNDPVVRDANTGQITRLRQATCEYQPII